MPNRQEEHLSVQNLSKIYSIKDRKSEKRQVCALKDVSLTVDRGEILCLAGPSGCGKSTLLDMIAGLSVPTAGRISLSGQDITGCPGMDRSIVMQGYALFPWLNVRENVEFGLRIQGIKREKRKEAALRYLSLVGLSGFERRYPHELSGGMKQRTAIARALVCEPDILLMDEPFAAVDAQTRESLQNELLGIWQKTQKTIVFVTHSIEEAVYLGSRVAVMTPSPGTVREIFSVPPVERNISFQNSHAYLELVAAVRQRLHDAG